MRQLRRSALPLRSTISGLAAAILDFQLKTTSGDIAYNTAESGICENGA